MTKTRRLVLKIPGWDKDDGSEREFRVYWACTYSGREFYFVNIDGHHCCDANSREEALKKVYFYAQQFGLEGIYAER